jgi:PPOX class probable F420-dependent enzyme
MTAQQGDVALLADPVAQELLCSREMAHLAYVWPDGTPRVVPIGFHWDGSRMLFGTPPGAPKLRALRQNPRVSVTVDSSSWPYHVLLLRGDVEIEDLNDVSPEYAVASHRYLGDDAGDAWVGQLRGKPMTRISLRPAWAGVLDFETRFPSALVL